MALIKRKAQAEDSSAVDAATEIARDFYSHSNNSDSALLEAAGKLRGLGLSRSQISDVRMIIPVACDGTARQKALRIDRVLKRLEKEAAGGS